MNMGMTKWVCAGGLALVLAACGGGDGEEQETAVAEAAPTTLAAGFYELTSEVTALASTDNTTPATPLKVGDKQTIKACVTAEGKPRPELLAEHGQSPDKCEIKSSYIRNGRMSAEMSCSRDGKSGSVMPAMNGSFSKDGFEGEITTLTYFVDDGDYRLTRKVSAKRVGDCPAGGAAEKAS